ncbi:hypothetical protein [Neisseria polysaccharea]|uniref:hypothetical protein n=1 Tax=Neisseria polysaccharea TaxID=489 RepID=UPI00272B9FB7|nr:hypothetical protein [Neisseria polysaccharea]
MLFNRPVFLPGIRIFFREYTRYARIGVCRNQAGIQTWLFLIMDGVADSTCAGRVLNFDFQVAAVSAILFFVCAATGILFAGQCPAAWAENLK